MDMSAKGCCLTSSSSVVTGRDGNCSLFSSSMLLCVQAPPARPALRGVSVFSGGGVSWTIGAICFEAPHACPPCCPLTDVSRDPPDADGKRTRWRAAEQRRRLAVTLRSAQHSLKEKCTVFFPSAEKFQ